MFIYYWSILLADYIFTYIFFNKINLVKLMEHPFSFLSEMKERMHEQAHMYTLRSNIASQLLKTNAMHKWWALGQVIKIEYL